MKKILLLASFCSVLVYGQEKKKIDHTVYNTWNSISAINQSKTGTIVTYEMTPLEGDGKLYIESLLSGKERSFDRGQKAKINDNEIYIAFSIAPEYDTIRQLKLDKVKPTKFPKDTLAVYWPETDSLHTVARVKSFKLPEEGNWLAYLSEDDERPDCPEKKCRLFKKKNKCTKEKTSGTTLHLMNPVNGTSTTLDGVVDYQFNKKGTTLAYVTSHEGKSDTLSIHILDLATGNMSETTLLTGQLAISKMQFDEEGQQLVFLHSVDTNKRKNFSLSYWKSDQSTAQLLIDSSSTGMPDGFNISEFRTPYFSKDGTRLFFGINDLVNQEPEDTLLDSEKATVDVWSGFDLEIQPQQLLSKKRDEKKSHLAVYHFSSKALVPLGNETLESVRTMNDGNADFALATDQKPYQKAMTWEFPWKRDIYKIDVNSGDKSLLKSAQAYGYSLSPSGDYFVWYDGPDSNWYCKPTGSENTFNLTGSLDDLFASDINGNPYVPHSEGSVSWTKINDKEFMLVYSRYDVWALCPSEPESSFSVTNMDGKSNKITYRLVRFDSDSTYTDLEAALLHAVDFESKAEALYRIAIKKNNTELEKLIESNHKYTFIKKADEADRILFRRMNFKEYPELEATNTQFENPKKLTWTNPQQSEYNWGTVEMVNWTSFEGRDLRGLLYKPEDFDSTKSYPMIVYFYEKYSEDIHNHYIPKPTASIVYPTEYVSNGYIIFIPDIEYTPGHPAKSAYDCIVSGTDYLTQKYNWIDSTRMGLQGQSWGGYQTAQLITMTTKYKAAMAGAPVSNMFSAYGGVRWGSGLSRMFQYERTQSRIGYTIWEKPELYIENSPIFALPNVQTPLLIMHNDGDGAVPWYQGIELYMGLRRLNQPVWLLNYNGDEHNLMKTANRRDLSIRMRQFFDYYLLEAPIPEWMESGVPALEKGQNYGLELKKNDP